MSLPSWPISRSLPAPPSRMSSPAPAFKRVITAQPEQVCARPTSGVHFGRRNGDADHRHRSARSQRPAPQAIARVPSANSSVPATGSGSPAGSTSVMRPPSLPDQQDEIAIDIALGSDITRRQCLRQVRWCQSRPSQCVLRSGLARRPEHKL